MANTVIVIAGPTASGKSALAAELARRVDGVVINADSQQLYAALPILTAQPGPDLTALASHKLYGIVDPTSRASAAWWAEVARGEIATAQTAGQVPILVGGTGLYLEALMQGLSAIPAIPLEVRAEAAADLGALGREAFYRRLVLADPDSAKLNIGDTQRLLRAWEVLQATGKPLSEWQTQKTPLPVGEAGRLTAQPLVGRVRGSSTGSPSPAALSHSAKSSASPTGRGLVGELDFHSIVILPPRDALRKACDRRFLSMLDQGAAEEVQAFLAIHPPDAPATRALGFAPLATWLAGKLSRDEAIAQGQAQTRQYAKRQSTWFRNRFLRINPTARIFESASEKTLEAVQAFTRA